MYLIEKALVFHTPCHAMRNYFVEEAKLKAKKLCWPKKTG